MVANDLLWESAPIRRKGMSSVKEVYTTKEAAKRMNTSVITIRRKVREHKLYPIQGLTGRFRFTDAEIRRFMYGPAPGSSPPLSPEGGTGKSVRAETENFSGKV